MAGLNVPISISGLQEAQKSLASFYTFIGNKETQINQMRAAGFSKTTNYTKAEIEKQKQAYASLYSFIQQNLHKLTDQEKSNYTKQLNNLKSHLHQVELAHKQSTQKQANDYKKLGQSAVSALKIGLGAAAAGVGLAIGGSILSFFSSGVSQLKDEMNVKYKILLTGAGDDFRGKSYEERKKIAGDVVSKSREADIKYGNAEGTTANRAALYTKEGGAITSFDPEFYAKISGTYGGEHADAVAKTAAYYSSVNKSASKDEINAAALGLSNTAILGSVPLEQMVNPMKRATASMSGSAQTKNAEGAALIQMLAPRIGTADTTGVAIQKFFEEDVSKGKLKGMFHGKDLDVYKTGSNIDKMQVTAKLFEENAKKGVTYAQTAKQAGLGDEATRAVLAFGQAMKDDNFLKKLMEAKDVIGTIADLERAAADKAEEPIVKFEGALNRLKLGVVTEFMKFLEESFGKIKSDEIKTAIDLFIKDFSMVLDGILSALYKIGAVNRESLTPGAAKQRGVESDKTLEQKGLSPSQIKLYNENWNTTLLGLSLRTPEVLLKEMLDDNRGSNYTEIKSKTVKEADKLQQYTLTFEETRTKVENQAQHLQEQTLKALNKAQFTGNQFHGPVFHNAEIRVPGQPIQPGKIN